MLFRQSRSECEREREESRSRSSDLQTAEPERHTWEEGLSQGGGSVSHKTFFFYLVLFWVLWPHWQTERDTKTRTSEHSNGSRDRGGGFFVYFFFLIFSVEGRGDGGLNDRTAKVQEVYFSVFAFFYIRAASLNFNYNMLSASVCIRVTAAISKATHSHTHTHARDTRRSMTSPQLLAHSTDHIPQSLWPEAYTI